MAAGQCNLSSLECDDLEFEGGLGAGQAQLGGSVQLALLVCLGLAAVALLQRLGLLLASSGRHRSRPSQPQKPPAVWSPLPLASVATGQRHPAAEPAGAGAAILSPRAAGLPRAFSPPPGAAAALRFSPTPRAAGSSGRKGGGTSAPRPPSGLLRHLAALGQQLRHRGTPMWLLGAGGEQQAMPAPQGRTASPGARYGLGLGEVESVDDESEDDLTTRELRALQQSPEFHYYLRGRGLTNDDVERTATKLRLYRRLRQLDPASFWLLCRAPARSFDTQDPPAWALVLEYLLSLAMNLMAAAAAYCAWADPALPALGRAACLAAAWWLTGAAWLQGRSAGGRLLGMWYEDLRSAHSAPLWGVAVANLAELVYVCGTLGLGAAVSLALRCRRGPGRRQQGVGEMCGGVRQVREVVVVEGPGRPGKQQQLLRD